MKNVLLGNTNLRVSKVGFGVLPIGNSQLNLPLNQGAGLIRYAMERKITFLDTAQYYKTYPYIRTALKGTNFDPVISSKSLAVTYTDMKAAIEEARFELNRDVIDIFLLHEVRTGDFINRQGAWDYLNDAKAKGLIKAIGLSTHHVDVAEMAAEIKECDILFPLINFKSLGIRKYDCQGNKEDMAAAIRRAAEAGIGVFAMKVFGGGNLTGAYQDALDYVYGLSGIESAMIGFGKEKEIDDIIDYMDGKLPKEYHPDVSKKEIHINQSDCEGCGACLKRCPAKAIYFGSNGLAEVNQNKCLTCGYCAPICPVRAIIMW